MNNVSWRNLKLKQTVKTWTIIENMNKNLYRTNDFQIYIEHFLGVWWPIFNYTANIFVIYIEII